jgi:repressor of nif and glnA expression
LNVKTAIEIELNGNGSCVGYRQMHQKMQKYGFAVARETVRIILKVLDPNGVKTRSRRCFQTLRIPW